MRGGCDELIQDMVNIIDASALTDGPSCGIAVGRLIKPRTRMVPESLLMAASIVSPF